MDEDMCRHLTSCLYERIRTVMQAEKCSVDRAIERVFADIGSDPDELQRWWAGMGPLFLKLTEEHVWKIGGPDVLKPRCLAPGVIALPEPEPIEVRPKWRDKVNPLDMLWRVGDSDVQKRLGDFTRRDVLACSNYYLERGRTLLQRGDKFGRVAELMGEDEKLEDALQRIAEANPDDIPDRLAPAVEYIAKTRSAA